MDTDIVTRWNEKEGRLWATEADRFDRIAEPHVAPLLRGAGLTAGWRVLDVGCGAGATTLSVAATVGTDGKVVGVDLSAPLLEVARRRAAGIANVELLEADATEVVLPPRSFDALIARSAIQLFPDPAAGLHHLRAALVPGGRFAATVWRDAAANGWSAIPAQVVARHLGGSGGHDPDGRRAGPGAFALADAGHLRAAVEGGGFVDVAVEPLDHLAVVGADVDDAVAFFDRVAGGALRTIAPPHVVDAIRADLRAALAAHVTPGGVAVPAAAWLVTAAAPG